jgi:hypothetical protein
MSTGAEVRAIANKVLPKEHKIPDKSKFSKVQNGFRASWKSGDKNQHIHISIKNGTVTVYPNGSSEKPVIYKIGKDAVKALNDLLRPQQAGKELQKAAARFKPHAKMAAKVAATVAAPVGFLAFPILFPFAQAGIRATVKAAHSKVGSDNSSTTKTVRKIAESATRFGKIVFKNAVSAATAGVSSLIGL